MKKLKQMWEYLWTKVKLHWELVVAFIVSYIIPVAMLSEIMAFTKEVPGGIKPTFIGCLALGILFIIFYKKIKESVIRMHKGILRGILRIFITAIFWSIIFGIIIGLQYISTFMKDYWIKVAYCFAIGHIFYMVDEIKKRKKKDVSIEEMIENE